MIYIVYLIILLLFLSFERQFKNGNNILRVIIPLMYILLIGLRGSNVGVDTETYYRHYYTFGQWGCDFVEVGFDWLNRFCYHRGWSQAPFFCICTGISIIPICFAIQKTLSRAEYSLFMLLFCTLTYVSFCNGMRQGIATGIFFALIVMAETTEIREIYRIILYIIGGLIASLFHASVLLVLPLYFMKYLKWSNKTYVLLYLFSFIFIFVNLSSYIPSIQLGNRDYGHFLGSAVVNSKASTLGFIVSTIRNILVIIILCESNSFKRFPLVANLVFVFLIISNIGYNIPLASRINMYFSFFIIYLIAKLFIEDNKAQHSKLNLYFTALFLILAVILIHGILSPANRMLPYTFTWEQPFYMHNSL